MCFKLYLKISWEILIHATKNLSIAGHRTKYLLITNQLRRLAPDPSSLVSRYRTETRTATVL